MSTDKTNKHAQATSDQRSDDNNNASQDAPPPTDNTHLSDYWPSLRKWSITHWFWISAHSINFLFAFFAHTPSSGIPILPGIIFTCIIFVHIFSDPIGPLPAEEPDSEKRQRLEEKRAQQRYRWMIFAYSFMLLSLLLTFYPFIKPFHEKPVETLRNQPIAVFIGCALNGTSKNLSCPQSTPVPVEKEAKNEPVVGAWAINIGGYVSTCEKDADNKTTTCQVRDGLLVPLYFIILALMGGSISLTRRLPELQKQVSTEHIATEQQPKLTQYEFREHLIFQIVQFISAPFLAILAYYLIDPSNTTNAVALAFTAGFASETILLMVRSIANKITPSTSTGPQYGAIAGIVTCGENNEPLAEKVEVFLSESPQIRSITDERGFYLLGNIPVGEHSISIKSIDQEQILKKDTVKIERAQAIVKKNVTIEQALR